jgi:Flp pilus assembly protein TadD
MLSWFLLLGSGLLIVMMLVRKVRVVTRDRIFQKHLEDEAAAQQEVVDAVEAKVASEAKKPDGSSVRKKFLKADTHFGRGEHEEARTLFLEVVEADDGHMDAHHKLGLLFMKTEDFPQAELYFSKLVNMKKDPVYFSNLGAALYQQQRLVEAAEAYENAIAMDARRGARLQSLAQVYYELGDDENALKYFELAARRKPKDVNLKIILADYYLRKDRFDDARSTLKKAADLAPYNEEVQALIKSIPKSQS